MANQIKLWIILIFANCCTANLLSYFGQSEPFRCEMYKSPSFIFSFDVTKCFLSTLNSSNRTHPEAGKSFSEIIASYGLNVTTHQVVSEDGYITTLYRIAGNSLHPPRRKKPAVLLVHGFGGSAKTWIIQHQNKNLAFKLVNAGYEVWLANLRGTNPSRGHLHLNSHTDLQFWEFGIQEIATKDIPVTIDLILKITGNDKIHYVCHSLGCIFYAIGLSDLPQLNDKIKSGVLLAPAYTLGRNYYILRPLAQIIQTSLEPTVFQLLGGRVESNSNEFLKSIGISHENFCKSPLIRCAICNNLISLMYGFDEPQLNYTNLPNIFGKLTDTMPLRILFHYLQTSRKCSMDRYDYGDEDKNMEVYGAPVPPTYNFSSVTTPTYIFYSEMDNLTPPPDTAQMKDSFSPGVVKGFYKVDWPLFHHIDYLIAKDADKLVYNKVLDILKQVDANDKK